MGEFYTLFKNDYAGAFMRVVADGYKGPDRKNAGTAGLRYMGTGSAFQCSTNDAKARDYWCFSLTATVMLSE